MGEFRASEADIKIFILEALQTILKTGGDIQEKPQRFFLNSKERFLIDTTNIDEYFTNTRYWNDSKLISPDNDQEKQEAYLMIKHLVPIVRSRTLRELNKVINENHYQPLIDDGLSIMMTPYSDFAFKEKEKAGFLAQLKTDYSDGGRFNSYEIAVYVTHIQDVKRWLWGRYMPEESGGQLKKRASGTKKPKGLTGFYCDKIMQQPEPIRTEMLSRQSGNTRFSQFSIDWFIEYKQKCKNAPKFFESAFSNAKIWCRGELGIIEN